MVRIAYLITGLLCRDDRIPGKSMVPLLSASTSLIMSCNSDSEGFWPSERITVPSSLVVIWPVIAEIHQYCVVNQVGIISTAKIISRSEPIEGRGKRGIESKTKRDH